MNGEAGADFAEGKTSFIGQRDYGSERRAVFFNIESTQTAGKGEVFSGGGIAVAADGDFAFAFCGNSEDEGIAGFGGNHSFLIKRGVDFIGFDVEKRLFFISSCNYRANAAVGIFSILIDPIGDT